MNLPEHQPEPDPARMRASDADRDRIADQLREALAEGRLSPEEHAERIDAVYTAKTYADLSPIVADLPDAQAPPVRLDKEPALPEPRRESATIVAIFGGADRKGRWLVEPHTNIVAIFGGIDLDFRQAVLTQREITLNITCVFGGVDIKVPPGVRVVSSAAGVFGAVSVPGDDPVEPDAPIIRITGLALFGGVDIKRREPRSDRREIRRQRRDERRDRLRELRETRREHMRDIRDHRHRH